MTLARPPLPLWRAAALFLLGLALYAVMFHGPPHALDPDEGVVYVLVLYPLALGAATPWLIDPAKTLGFWQINGWAMLLITVLSVALVFLGFETLICVFIGLPLTLPLLMIGTAIGRELTGSKSPTSTLKSAAATALPAALAFLPVHLPSPAQHITVTNQITIAAPAAKVWSQIIDVPEVTPDEHIPSITHTLLRAPRPVKSYMDGQTRHAIWDGGLAYREDITHMAEPHAMDWTISFPRGYTMPGFDDHISPNSDQLRLTQGRYRLTETAHGTLVSLSTDMILATPLNSYIGAWGKRMLRDNHSSILHFLKHRAEANA